MTAAREGGCEILPTIFGDESALPGLITDRGYHWELSEWMPGQPLSVDATPDQIRLGAKAIASFHRATRPLGVSVQPPPAVMMRIRRAEELCHRLPTALDRHPVAFDNADLTTAINDACRLLRQKWGEVSAEFTRSLSRYQSICVETQYVLRDVHRQHVLFDNEKVTALIDFDAIRVDTPAADLARWIGSFPAAKTVGEAAVAGYFEDSPSSERLGRDTQEALVREICRASTWINLSNWVVWIVLEGWTCPGGPHQVAARIDELIRFAVQEE